MPSTFPLEIEETILDFLADDEGHLALKTCSLVCQAFLPICRKHIFGSIVLNDDNLKYPSTTHAFERLLLETPEIADYIRKLDYTIPTDLTNPSIRFEESLKRISRLEFLTVRDLTRFYWSNHPVRPALLYLLHLPTLTHFQVIEVNDFILSDLIPCVNLKYLNIDHNTTVAAENIFPATLPEHSIQLNEFIAGFGTTAVAAIMKLCTAQRPDGQPIIDFGSLSKITVNLDHPNEVETSQELFRRSYALTSVTIFFWDLRRNVRPSLADMLRPSMQTLKRIVVDIHVYYANVDPLFGIPSELDDMRNKNIIESITIGIIIDSDIGCHIGEYWGRLDEVLTAPGWFSLKRVSLAIELAFYDGSDNELEVGLRELPETQFPRLSSSNSVSFDFKVIPTWI